VSCSDPLAQMPTSINISLDSWNVQPTDAEADHIDRTIDAWREGVEANTARLDQIAEDMAVSHRELKT
jgi:hypothetical protein